jgi:hypothetical protein
MGAAGVPSHTGRRSQSERLPEPAPGRTGSRSRCAGTVSIDRLSAVRQLGHLDEDAATATGGRGRRPGGRPRRPPAEVSITLVGCCLASGSLGGRHPASSNFATFCVRTGIRLQIPASVSLPTINSSRSPAGYTRAPRSSMFTRSCTTCAGLDGPSAWDASGRAETAQSPGRSSPGTGTLRMSTP